MDDVVAWLIAWAMLHWLARWYLRAWDSARARLEGMRRAPDNVVPLEDLRRRR